jgi:hypothetical protein
MRTGKLNISRGSEIGSARASEPRLALVEPAPAAASRTDDEEGHHAVLERLDALERFARLRSLDLLTADEFDAEKANLLIHSGAKTPSGAPVNPSLAGRMFSWAFLPIGLVAGLALSFGAQPEQTVRFFDQALRLFGA